MAEPLPFWKTKTLAEMTAPEWESLCDGCGKCCLVKLEDEDTGALAFTEIACHLLDCQSCQCKDYENRSQIVPDCVKLTPESLDEIDWLPDSCAYRLVADGDDLPNWHPLVSGERDSVHRAGASVQGRVHLTDRDVPLEHFQDYIADWPMDWPEDWPADETAGRSS
ncbi:MAG: YcgN family cysteine cluster protein [Parvibaculaceae bacterium]|nr:YcgN family cysteine cluster protein [Parvibaculaceae bacterium]